MGAPRRLKCLAARWLQSFGRGSALFEVARLRLAENRSVARREDRREELLTELSRYVPSDADDAAALARLRELLSAPEDPFSREWRDHVTGSVVVARSSGESFLLVHHRHLDRWLQPGGHVEEEDPTVFEAALREAREETGVAALETPFGSRILDVDIHPIPAKKKRPEHIHYDVRYVATTREHAFTAQQAEVREARWFSYEEALAAGGDASLERALRKAMAWLGAGR